LRNNSQAFGQPSSHGNLICCSSLKEKLQKPYFKEKQNKQQQNKQQTNKQKQQASYQNLAF